jgi:hypothetical protein
MTAVLPEAERRARRRRLVVILVVAVVILGGVFAVGAIRNHSLADKADSATTELRSKWRTADLAALVQKYQAASFDADTSGNYDATIKVFPHTAEASFVNADMNTPGVVSATYRIDGWGGSSECLFVTARGTQPPNRVSFSTGGSHC